MFFPNEDRTATIGKADREYAHNKGRDNPDRCWILSDRDCWYRNFFYTGPDQPHPEAACYDEDEPNDGQLTD